MFDFQLSEETQEYILNLFQRYVDDGLNFINKKCHQAIPQVDISKVTTLCCLLESLILEKDRVNLTMVGSFLTAVKLGKCDYPIDSLQINNSKLSVIQLFDFQVNFLGD